MDKHAASFMVSFGDFMCWRKHTHTHIWKFIILCLMPARDLSRFLDFVYFDLSVCVRATSVWRFIVAHIMLLMMCGDEHACICAPHITQIIWKKKYYTYEYSNYNGLCFACRHVIAYMNISTRLRAI